MDFLKIKDLLKKKLPLRTACSKPVKIQEANNSIVSLKFYTAAHRRKDVSSYSTNLTEVEWDLVADLFERSPGSRATPAHYSRRELVSACSYVLRTGLSWQLLPETFPPWQAIYKAFVR